MYIIFLVKREKIYKSKLNINFFYFIFDIVEGWTCSP